MRPVPNLILETSSDILSALGCLRDKAAHLVCSGEPIQKWMADRIEAFERELTRRGDAELMLGLRTEYGDRMYDRSDLECIAEAMGVAR